LNKKTQVLTPEALGEMVYEVVNMTVPALLNPKMTGTGCSDFNLCLHIFGIAASQWSDLPGNLAGEILIYIGVIAGRELNDEEVKQLLSEGRTGVLKGFTSKNKKKFSACLVMTKDEEGKPNITFDS